MRKAHIRDGAALARFLAWFERERGGRRADRDRGGRDAGRLSAAPPAACSDVSFDTISGAGSNGAIVHYRVTRSTNRTIQPERDVPDGLRRAISRRHHRRHPHHHGGRADGGDEATASPAC